MRSTIAVGVDGSAESLAAAGWAAREAELRSAVLRVVHAGDQPPHAYVPFAGEAVPLPHTDLSARMLSEVRASLAYRRPGLRIIAEQVPGQPATALPVLARETDLLVLGSRGLGRTTGALLGSVATAAVARAERPVVLERLVRTGPRSWAARPDEVFVRIEPELVTGRELLGGRTLYGVDLAR
ncbi:universal stress protein [Streptomyces minutiscleroticus]|uniref:universal stress protein n=1 Tax=Streptomyces minutiscleroticus TaxID=68238 RepID=UPI0033287254